MPDYSLEHFRRDLRAALLPHSIYIDSVDGGPKDITIRTSRINGTKTQMRFVLPVVNLTPELGTHMATTILDWYDHHR